METPNHDRRELLRVLGFWTAVAVTVGSVIGSGVFKKPQAVAQNIASFDLVVLAWVLGGLLAVMGAMALAELGAMLPRAGGNYVYLKEAYGPIWGFLWGWVEYWILRTGSIAALATVFSESLAGILEAQVLGAESTAPPLLAFLVTDEGIKTMTLTAIALLAIVNAVGVRYGGWVQNVTTWIKVGSLVGIGLLPFLLGQADMSLLSQVGAPPQKGVFIGFFAAVLGVLWAYHGWMNLSPLGEEIRDPQRNVPRALLIGVGIVMAVYLAANVAYAVVLPREVMADPLQVRVVAISFAERVLAPWGTNASALAGTAISAAIMMSTFGALNANILVGPRTYFALGRDGLFPRYFGQVHARFKTPALSILLQAGWAIGLVLGADWIRESEKESPFDTLTNYVMFGAIIFETMVIAAIFRFRRLHPEWHRPYRCWGYPFVPMIYVAILAVVLVVTIVDQPKKSLVGFGFILVGAAVHLIRMRFWPPPQPIAAGEIRSP